MTDEELRRELLSSMTQTSDCRAIRAKQNRTVRVLAVDSLISDDIVFFIARWAEKSSLNEPFLSIDRNEDQT